MTNRTVSVIVPVYNAENYLKKCVDSIRQQTYTNLEILLVDDGAKDKSPAMCDAYAAEDSRIRVIHKENGGLISAWTAGTEAATGAYLCYVDSDDWIDLDMIEKLAAQATDVPGEIICCGYQIERPDGSTPGDHGLEAGCYTGEALENVKGDLLGNPVRKVIMSRCMKLTSPELIRKNIGYCDKRVRMGEDLNIMLPAILDCERLVIIKNEPCYHYYYNTASMVHAYDARMEENIRVLGEKIKQVYADRPTVANGASQAERELVYLYLLCVKNELRGGPIGYAARVKELCERADLARMIRQYEIKGGDKATSILLWTAVQPNFRRCRAARAIYRIFDGLFR